MRASDKGSPTRSPSVCAVMVALEQSSRLLSFGLGGKLLDENARDAVTFLIAGVRESFFVAKLCLDLSNDRIALVANLDGDGCKTLRQDVVHRFPLNDHFTF